MIELVKLPAPSMTGGHKILSNAFQKCADWKIRHNSFEKSPFLSFVNFKTPYPGICQPTQQNTELKTKQLFIVNDSKIRNVEFFLPLRIQNIQRVGILNVLGAVDELSPLKKKPKIHYINNEVLGAIKHIPASSTDVIKDRVKNNQGIKIPCTSGANTNTTDSSFPDNSLSIHNEHQRTKEKSEISNTDSKEPKHYLSSFGGFRKDVQVMIHNLIFMFRETGLNQGSQEFLNFCSHKMTPGICRYIERVTETQYESSLWHRLKFGRVTASQLYAVAKCRTTEGYLVKNLLGARTWFSGSYATLRGKRLEEEVCQAVERQEGLKFRKCGLFLSGDYPILGASPDGINETYVLEIKCPASMKSFGKYISDDDKIGIKFMAQIQLQMLLSGRKKGIFCVAHPNFESSQQVRVKYVDLDEKLISSLTNPAIEFWKANVFPVLIKIKKESERGE